MPRREEAGERLLLDRLDLLAQRGERPTAELAQYVDVAEFARHPLGPELADDETFLAFERRERTGDPLGWCTEPPGDLGGEEWPVGAGVAADDLLQRTGNRLGERHRQAERQRAPECVAVASGVLRGGVAGLAAERDLDHPRSRQPTSPATHGRPRPSSPPGPSHRSSTSSAVRSPTFRNTSCNSSAERARRPSAMHCNSSSMSAKHLGVEQLAQFLGTEEIAQEVPIECQRRGPPLGERSVAFVHVRGDPVEQQARRHRARLARVDGDHPDRPRPQQPEHLAQRRHVEHVLEALARRLQQDRERRVLRRDRQEVGGALTLLPQRCATVGSAARQQQCPARALAEARREQCGLREGLDDEFVDVLRVDHQRLDRQLDRRLGQADHDAVVAPHRLDRDVELVHQAPLDRHRPRRVHRRAERAEDADAPVADLVLEPLDDHGAVVGHRAGRLDLLGEVLREVAGGERVEVVVRHQPLGGGRVVEVADLADESLRAPGPTPADDPDGRRARTASCPAGPAPG